MGRKIGKRKRKESQKPQSGSYLIVSEGEKTEVLYFKSLANKINEKRRGVVENKKIEIPPIKLHGTGYNTESLVKKAIEIRRKDPNIYENHWLVYDKDSFKTDMFDNSITFAEANGFKVAWSNESFELWYLLHFKYCESAIGRDQYIIDLNLIFQKKFNCKYLKNDNEVYEKISPFYEQAIMNAKRLDRLSNAAPSTKNPCTKVYELVEELENIYKSL